MGNCVTTKQNTTDHVAPTEEQTADQNKQWNERTAWQAAPSRHVTTTSQSPPPPPSLSATTSTTTPTSTVIGPETAITTTGTTTTTTILTSKTDTTAPTVAAAATSTVASDGITTIKVLVFNVSGGSGDEYASLPELLAGINNVLNQDEVRDSIANFLFLVLANDNVTNTKQEVFKQHGLLPVAVSQSGIETIVFMNQKAYSSLDPNALRSVFNILSSKTKDAMKTNNTECFNNTVPHLNEHNSSIEGVTEEERSSPRDVQNYAQEALNNLALSEMHLPTINDGDDLFMDYLNRMSFYVTKPISPSNIRMLVVSWHGQYKIKEKRVEFEKLVYYVEILRQEHNADVAMIGGDFNLALEEAQAVVPGAYVVNLPVHQERSKVIDYLIIWPARCLISQRGSRQIFPTQPGYCWPFDHPTLLYTLNLKQVA